MNITIFFLFTILQVCQAIELTKDQRILYGVLGFFGVNLFGGAICAFIVLGCSKCCNKKSRHKIIRKV
jgi:hypothetical protein